MQKDPNKSNNTKNTGNANKLNTKHTSVSTTPAIIIDEKVIQKKLEEYNKKQYEAQLAHEVNARIFEEELDAIAKSKIK